MLKITPYETVCFSVGGNLGDRRANLEAGARFLSRAGLKILRFSAVYETPAWGMQDQPDFYNMVWLAESPFGPEETLQIAQAAEKEAGRERNIHWGPRTLDIDLLFFGRQIIRKPALQVPHPLLHLRAFVLGPAAEIIPDFIHPELHKTVAELYRECSDSSSLRRLENLFVWPESTSDAGPANYLL